MKNSDVYSRKISRVLTVKAIPELITSHLACEKALRGALAAVWEKEGELATTSLEFEYLHRKSRCDMLIGGDDICNDVITLHTCFSMFVYIRAPFRLAPIVGNLTAQSTGSHTGFGGGIEIPETKLQALLHFPAPPPERPRALSRRLRRI